MTETKRHPGGRGHLSPAPTPEQLEGAVRMAGSVTKAAAGLDVNLRTLQRQIARTPELHAAACRGRTAWWEHTYPHGHVQRYKGPTRCRCELCRAANTAQAREWRASR